MSFYDKVIYTQRYEPKENPDLSEGDTYIPLPRYEEKAVLFMDTAISLAEKRRLSIDISRSFYFLRADFHVEGAEDFGHDTGVLVELMTLCDRFSVHQGSEHQRITLRFVLFTHEFYHNGCLMNEW